MDYKKIIDKLVRELSYRVGIPNVENKDHQSIMSEILSEWGEYDVKERIFEFLTEKDEKFNATNKKSGETVTFKSKEARDAAIEAGTHTDVDKNDDDTETTQGSALKSADYQKRVKKEKEIRKQIDGEDDNNQQPENDEEGSELSEERKEELRSKDEELVNTQLFLYEGDDQDAGGLGTPESRTGETVTVYAGTRIKQLMADGKMDYKTAREQVRQELLEHTKSKKGGKKALLTKEWVESGLRCLDWINENYDIDEVENFAWDTPEGNELVGSTGHGTSADMFIKTKDGKTIGISLKKDFKVFVFNGGYDKNIGKFAESLGLSLDELPDELQYEGNPKSYKSKREKIFEERIELFNNDDVKKKVCENIEKAKSSDEGYIEVFAKRTVTNKKRLKRIADNAGKEISDVTCDDFYNFVLNKPKKTNEDKAVIYAFAQYDSEIEKGTNGLYSETRKLDNVQRDSFYSFVTTQPYEEKFKEVIAEHTHIDDVLFGTKGDQLDKLEVVYGEPPAGESMKKEALVAMFDLGDLYEEYENEKDPQKKQELEDEIKRKYKEKMIIDKESNPPRIGVLIANPVPPPDTSIQPLFTLGVRAKGITAAPALEMGQTAFGGLCFKNGNVDINKWPDEDRKKFVVSEVNRIQEDFDGDFIDYTNKSEVEELISYLERLDKLKSVPKGKRLIDLIKSKQQ